MKNSFKNHVYVMLDRSGSMANIIDTAKDVFNKQIDSLREQSLLHDQETRISFYTFADDVQCVISDVDVARPVKLESIFADGSTAIRDAMTLALQDATAIPQKYGDHSFIFYLITDGEENASRTTPLNFITSLRNLPENFTVAAFVPDNNGKQLLSRMGVPEGNIDVWNTTKEGVEEVGQKFSDTMGQYFTARKTGLRSSTTLFTDLKQVNSQNVGSVLDILDPSLYDIVINETTQAIQIKPLVESRLKRSYTKGGGFYELVKNEHVQPSKQIAVQNKKNGRVYTGSNARTLLSLPNREVKIVPEDFGEWIVFIQSTSVNRNIIPKQRVLVLK